MTSTIKLPSGKLIDLAHFVALLPDEEITDRTPIDEQWDKEAQLRRNQPLMKLIEQWRERNNGQTATEEEIQEYQDIKESLTRNPSIKQV